MPAIPACEACGPAMTPAGRGYHVSAGSKGRTGSEQLIIPVEDCPIDGHVTVRATGVAPVRLCVAQITKTPSGVKIEGTHPGPTAYPTPDGNHWAVVESGDSASFCVKKTRSQQLFTKEDVDALGKLADRLKDKKRATASRALLS